MRSKLIAIAIGLALILGIVLIGGIRITRANELSPSVDLQQSRVLLNRVRLERGSQRTLVSRSLGRVLHRESNLDRGTLDRLENLRTLRNGSLRVSTL